LFGSIVSSSIIAGAHFLSSIAVVLAFIFVSMFIQIPQTYMNYAVGIALAILAFMFWREKSEDLAKLSMDICTMRIQTMLLTNTLTGIKKTATMHICMSISKG
jgi:hypothetical protein